MENISIKAKTVVMIFLVKSILYLMNCVLLFFNNKSKILLAIIARVFNVMKIFKKIYFEKILLACHALFQEIAYLHTIPLRSLLIVYIINEKSLKVYRKRCFTSQ
jgi:hypothetical protein